MLKTLLASPCLLVSGLSRCPASQGDPVRPSGGMLSAAHVLEGHLYPRALRLVRSIEQDPDTKRISTTTKYRPQHPEPQNTCSQRDARKPCYTALAKQQKLGLAICFRRVLCCHLQAGADLILFVDASHLAKLTNQEAPCEGAVKPAGSRNRPSCGEQGEAVRSVGLPGAEFRLHLPVRAATLLLGLNNAEPYHERDPRLRQNGERGERLPATSSCSCPSRKTCRQGEAGPQTLHCSPAACTDASAIPHSVI